MLAGLFKSVGTHAVCRRRVNEHVQSALMQSFVETSCVIADPDLDIHCIVAPCHEMPRIQQRVGNWFTATGQDKCHMPTPWECDG